MAAPRVIGTKAALKEVLRTKSGLAAVGMLMLLMGIVAAIPVIAPFNVVRAWGDSSAWTDNPRNAAPEWVDALSEKRMARTIIIEPGDFREARSNTSTAFSFIILRARWDFEFDEFPRELTLELRGNWTSSLPIVTVIWQRPDGESLTIWSRSLTRKDPQSQVIAFDSSPEVISRVRFWALALGAQDVEDVRPRFTLQAIKGPEMLDQRKAQILTGRYAIVIEAIVFSEADWVSARFKSLGSVYGLMGTDHMRRDLLIGLMWGAPVALSFGMAAAVMTVFSQVILGALGAYYGGRFDEFIQRAADFFLIIPVLPILILIGVFYTPSIVIILFIVVAFSIVGGTTKVVRSIALQVREELHIEAARSYGAARARILFRYIMPRTMPYTFALLALSVPSFIFLEAALSFLGLGDPILPTWGAIMGDAYQNGAMYNGLWWWIAFPALGILFVTVAFAILGYAFDKVLNPRLREE